MSESPAHADMVNAAREILAWQKTGVLEGDALRKIARVIREQFSNVFDMSQAIAQAEEQVKREALKFLINGEGTALSEAEQRARREALEEAAQIGYVTCAETRHVTLGDKVRSSIRALIPSEPHDAEGRE